MLSKNPKTQNNSNNKPINMISSKSKDISQSTNKDFIISGTSGQSSSTSGQSSSSNLLKSLHQPY